MTADDRTAADLERLGVHPITVLRLRGYADLQGVTLRQLIAYVLGDYVPATVSDPKGTEDDGQD